MGSCVSLHKDSQKLRLSLDSKNQNLIIPSPVKQKSFTVNGQDHSAADLAVMSRRSRTRSRADGSKDDAFFDSQPWLESDCEDDFLSVNGDFTPSRGSTPVHHRFSSGNPMVNKPPPVPEPSPKKRLSELFKESLRHQQGGDKEEDASEESVVVENGASGEKSGYGAEEKSVQCCLPRLRSRRTFATAQVEKV
ncbi:hypothetical protein SASPL_128220 [Salvia splendens]|uniref:Uncharacterized protein n=1 Tax=Salvia splendens TaxID=180675 RepID=A0A8X8XCN9_SALSN|nr:uncharacterized protein At3g27210-like isoform X1 [Salvia splendens]KAG6410169.1 hypothetical protein SASPL_128220 [Salvia splendens]